MNIKEIKDSKFLKNMKNDELEALANDIRHFLLENVSKTGGHVLYMLYNKQTEGSTLTIEQAKQKASDFLVKKG